MHFRGARVLHTDSSWVAGSRVGLFCTISCRSSLLSKAEIPLSANVYRPGAASRTTADDIGCLFVGTRGHGAAVGPLWSAELPSQVRLGLPHYLFSSNTLSHHHGISKIKQKTRWRCLVVAA